MSAVFSDVDSVANGLFVLYGCWPGGGGMANTGIPAPLACPAVGWLITGRDPPPPTFTSSRSAKSS